MKTKAYTLIELLLTISIIAIILAISLPTLSKIYKREKRKIKLIYQGHDYKLNLFGENRPDDDRAAYYYELRQEAILLGSYDFVNTNRFNRH